MGYFSSNDNRWENVKFKKLVITSYALFVIIAGALMVRIMNGWARLEDTFDFPTLIIAGSAIGLMTLGVSYVIWRMNREKRWKLMDVIYPAGCFAGCCIIGVMHILVTQL